MPVPTVVFEELWLLSRPFRRPGLAAGSNDAICDGGFGPNQRESNFSYPLHSSHLNFRREWNTLLSAAHETPFRCGTGCAYLPAWIGALKAVGTAEGIVTTAEGSNGQTGRREPFLNLAFSPPCLGRRHRELVKSPFFLGNVLRSDDSITAAFVGTGYNTRVSCLSRGPQKGSRRLFSLLPMAAEAGVVLGTSTSKSPSRTAGAPFLSDPC